MTIDQVTILYNHYKQREYEQFKIKAALAGVKIKDDLSGPSSTEKIQPGATPALFGDPESYAHLTEKERQEMTQRMMKGHRQMGLMRS